MQTAIDRAGRIVLPKSLREEAGRRPGTPIEVRYVRGAIRIEPLPTPVTLRRRGPFVVAVTAENSPALSTETVRRVRNLLHDVAPRF